DRPGHRVGPALVEIGIAGLGLALLGVVLLALPDLPERHGWARIAKQAVEAWPWIGLAIGTAATATVVWWFRRQTGGEYRSCRATDRSHLARSATFVVIAIGVLIVAVVAEPFVVWVVEILLR